MIFVSLAFALLVFMKVSSMSDKVVGLKWQSSVVEGPRLLLR